MLSVAADINFPPVCWIEHMSDWIERHPALVLSGIGLLIAGAIGLFALRWQPASSIVIEPPAPTATPGPVRVYISGAVVRADVYSLPPNAIVRDALDAAGGPALDADLDRVNLAAPLADGDHVYVPRVGETPSIAVPDSGGASASGGPVNINTATQEELEQLPGIGPSLAAAIIQYREEHGPFASIEDIQNVPGIGPTKFEAIKDLITVG